MKKKKIKTVKQELMFPKQLNREDLSLIHTPSPRDAHESRMPSSA